jgi:hypothetical protein
LGIGNYADIFHNYYNIDLVWKSNTDIKVTSDEILNIVSSGKPVIVKFGLPYFTESNIFNKARREGYFLITGIENEKVCFLNPYESINEEIMSIDDLLLGVDSYCIVNFDYAYEKRLSSKEHLSHIICRLGGFEKSGFNQNMFSDLKIFEENIRTNSDLINYIRNEKNLIYSTLVSKINCLGNGRKNFAGLLSKCKIDDDYIEHIVRRLWEASELWDRLKWLIIKGHFVKDKEKYTQIIAGCICMIHDYEKSLYDKIVLLMNLK